MLMYIKRVPLKLLAAALSSSWAGCSTLGFAVDAAACLLT